jgi:hypothetical protein
MTDHLQDLEGWFSEQCNEEWEHSYGLTIETLDNPGWSVRIDVAETPLATRVFPPVKVERSQNDWIDCHVKDNVFEGRGGPHNLGEIVETFFKWGKG